MGKLSDMIAIWRDLNEQQRIAFLRFITQTYKENFVRTVNQMWDEYKKGKL